MADWILSASTYLFYFYYSYSSSASPGGALAGVASVLLFIGAILTSIAGCCCVGNLPGIGRSGSCCCCVEQLAMRVDDAHAIVAPPPPPVLIVGAGSNDMTLRTMASYPGGPGGAYAQQQRQQPTYYPSM